MTPIDDKYQELGGAQGFLGQPVTVELPTPNGLGSYRHFQGGSIYWNHILPIAFEIHGLIREKWAALGWENSFLGFPISDELPVPPSVPRGRVNNFEGGGAIAWTPNTGAHEVHGAIFRRWVELGRESGLGFPLTDELTTPDGRGRYNHFEQGSIYWTPQTGAHEVKDSIKNSWALGGWERGPLGYPVGTPGNMPGSITTFQDFEHGVMYDWLSNSRTVILNTTVVALPGNFITWGDFGRTFADGDVISVAFGTGHPPNGNVNITLILGPSLTWWKGVSLWSPGAGDIAQATVDGSRRSGSISIAANSIGSNGVFLQFKKAKFAGTPTGMYWLGQVHRLTGNDVTFTWLRD